MLTLNQSFTTKYNITSQVCAVVIRYVRYFSPSLLIRPNIEKPVQSIHNNGSNQSKNQAKFYPTPVSSQEQIISNDSLIQQQHMHFMYFFHSRYKTYSLIDDTTLLVNLKKEIYLVLSYVLLWVFVKQQKQLNTKARNHYDIVVINTNTTNLSIDTNNDFNQEKEVPQIQAIEVTSQLISLFTIQCNQFLACYHNHWTLEMSLGFVIMFLLITTSKYLNMLIFNA